MTLILTSIEVIISVKSLLREMKMSIDAKMPNSLSLRLDVVLKRNYNCWISWLEIERKKVSDHDLSGQPSVIVNV